MTSDALTVRRNMQVVGALAENFAQRHFKQILKIAESY
jgi:hypothetical protein